MCADCSGVFYPPRDACPKCLSPRVPFVPVDNRGTLVGRDDHPLSTDPYFRERTPWRPAEKLDAGPVMLTHLHGDVERAGACGST